MGALLVCAGLNWLLIGWLLNRPARAMVDCGLPLHEVEYEKETVM